MTAQYRLPLTEALTKAGISKTVFKEFTGYTESKAAYLEDVGVDIIEADKVATALGYHPSELWSGWTELLFQVLQWREEDPYEDE
jgi:hypothetical protein